MDAVFWHRLQFAFTITYHYLFPQLTMGLALLILVMKTLSIGFPIAILYFALLFRIHRGKSAASPEGEGY